MSSTLRKAGYSADCARCGQPAFDALDSDTFDVVVLFPCAPGEDGLRLLVRARARQGGAEFIVVADDNRAETAVQAMTSDPSTT